ncbi:unnamed protein product [Sphagnum troendelagicum]|uniref:B box-type domain-containing protein n=1 Tax=Sphagnum troendelagicum TaxID=128251 RepID=A0ABP0U7P6_9BRYO
MSSNQACHNLAGGRFCEDCEEAARELLWCEHCGIALCFECDSHCHHAKSSRSSHLRVLLPSAGTLSSVPLVLAQSRHGGGDLLSEVINPAKVWRSGSHLGLSPDVSELQDGRGNVFDSLPPTYSLKDKRRRKKKKGKGSITLSNTTECAPNNNFELQKSQQEQEAGGTLPSSVLSSLKPSTPNIAIRGESKLSDHGENSMHKSETTDLSLSSSSEHSSPILSVTKSTRATLEPLKSALRGGHEGIGLGPRPKLHVNWHPDVYDPICSTVSHTLGQNQQLPIFLSRHSYQKHLRHKNKGHSNSQSSGKKQGSIAKAKKWTNQVVLPPQAPIADDLAVQMDELLVDQPEINESMATGFPESCHRAVRCMIHAAKLAVQGEPSGAMVEYEAAARLFREAERSVLKDAAPESKEVAKQAVRGQVAAWISVAALYAQTGHTCWAEKCHLQVLRACQSSGLRLDAGKCLLEAGKCQLIRGEWNRAHALFTAAILLFKDCEAEREENGNKEVNSEADNYELKELVVKAGRLAGAAALQGHNVDAGKKLLLGALVAARQLQLKAEEARCLRLLANLQQGEQYLKSLQAAVDSFSVCDLPYEHAEALFCLASLKTTLHLKGSWKNQSMSRSQGDAKQLVLLEAVKHDLKAAAFLLQGKSGLSNDSFLCRPSVSKLQDASKLLVFQLPNGHEQAGEKESSPCVGLCVDECGSSRNMPVYSELLGRIHGACAQVCVLLEEKIEAETYLTLALKNKEWVSRCKEDASRAEALLERLQWQGSGTCRKSWQVLEGSLIGV